MAAILFGSISTLVDTSELQRRSFNEAFDSHHLDWTWSQEEYRSMLGSNGGADRIAQYATDRNVEVDASAVHATKSEIFQRLVAETPLEPRPGVTQLLALADSRGVKVGFVTTTSRANVDAVLGALGPDVSCDSFEVIVYSSSVSDVKPHPAAYSFALEALGERAEDCVAIEDNAGGVEAATAAGVTCVAFPNQNTSEADFSGAVETVDALDADRVHALMAA